MAVNPRGRILSYIYYWLPVAVIMGFIYATSSLPGRDVPSLFPYQDVLYHAAIYVILALFFFRALRRSLLKTEIFPLLLLTTAVCALYGVSDELHQLFVPGRSCSGFDLAVDAMGSFIGAACGGVYSRWRPA